MRIAVTGASGNVGSALLRALEAEDQVDEVVAIARRPPAERTGKAVWRAADVSSDDLVPLLRGANAVCRAASRSTPAFSMTAAAILSGRRPATR